MTHPRVADGGGGLQIRRVAANILNVADNRQGVILQLGGLGGGIKIHQRRRRHITKYHTRHRDFLLGWGIVKKAINLPGL
jgi:hypothetical protein